MHQGTPPHKADARAGLDQLSPVLEHRRDGLPRSSPVLEQLREDIDESSHRVKES
jgi:hypothetical protein